MCRVFPNSHKTHNYNSLFVDESLKLDDVQNISVHSGNTQIQMTLYNSQFLYVSCSVTLQNTCKVCNKGKQPAKMDQKTTDSKKTVLVKFDLSIEFDPF